MGTDFMDGAIIVLVLFLAGRVSGCCEEESNNYNIWSLWYFWCIMLFLMMACFGACGYWRRRRLYNQAHSRQMVTILTSNTPQTLQSGRVELSPYPTGATNLPPHTVQSGRVELSPYPMAPKPQLGIDAPPPYSEVTSKPTVYPPPPSGNNSTPSLPQDMAYPPQMPQPNMAASYPPPSYPTASQTYPS